MRPLFSVYIDGGRAPIGTAISDPGSPMANQHDKIFKQLLHAFLDDFLRLVVPETYDRLDLSSPEFLDKELFEGGPRGRRRELDLLVRVHSVTGRRLMIHV